MIEVDLAPERSRSRTHRARRLRAGKGMAGIRLDGWILTCGLVVLGSLGASAYLAITSSREVSALELLVEDSLQDSAQSAESNRSLVQLHERLDSIKARISTIEDLDATRYRWPHILDEVAVALPQGAWITRIADVAAVIPGIRFQVEGHALDNFALTRFWNALEASFFIRDVQLISTEYLERDTSDGNGGLRASYHFVLGASYEDPPNEVVEFVRIAGGAP